MVATFLASDWCQKNTRGAIHSTKISENFGPKLNGSVRSNRKSFEKTGPPFEVDHFSRSDRLEFWLNGSRPSDLKLSSDACYLGGDPPQCWMRLRAKMLPAMHRREIPRWLSPGSEGWRLPCQNETTGVVVKRERPFCGMWSLTFRPHPRGMVGPRNTTINDIPAQTKGFLYSYEHLNNFRTSRTFILTDFSVY